MRAFVTGATSSIGKIIARQLAGDGYELVLHYHSNKEAAGQLASELKATLVQADLSAHKEVEKLRETLLAGEKFDVIVNNARVSANEEDTDLNAWEQILLGNTIVPALIMGYAAKLINDDGVVINISSAYGHERFGEANKTAYSASKAALNSLTRTFAKKLSPRVRVNAIAPGYVDSKWNENRSAEDRQRLANQQLTGKLVTPQQVADLASHIIMNTAFDGEVIYLDGGLTLKTI